MKQAFRGCCARLVPSLCNHPAIDRGGSPVLLLTSARCAGETGVLFNLDIISRLFSCYYAVVIVMSPHAAVRARSVTVVVEILLLLHVLAVGHVAAIDVTVAATLRTLCVVARSRIRSTSHRIWIVRFVAELVERLCIRCGVDQWLCRGWRGWRFNTRLWNVSLLITLNCQLNRIQRNLAFPTRKSK